MKISIDNLSDDLLIFFLERVYDHFRPEHILYYDMISYDTAWYHIWWPHIIRYDIIW